MNAIHDSRFVRRAQAADKGFDKSGRDIVRQTYRQAKGRQDDQCATPSEAPEEQCRQEKVQGNPGQFTRNNPHQCIRPRGMAAVDGKKDELVDMYQMLQHTLSMYSSKRQYDMPLRLPFRYASGCFRVRQGESPARVHLALPVR